MGYPRNAQPVLIMWRFVSQGSPKFQVDTSDKMPYNGAILPEALMNEGAQQSASCCAVAEYTGPHFRTPVLCKESATTTIHVKTRTADVVVQVCGSHGSKHKERAMALRKGPTQH